MMLYFWTNNTWFWVYVWSVFSCIWTLFTQCLKSKVQYACWILIKLHWLNNLCHWTVSYDTYINCCWRIFTKNPQNQKTILSMRITFIRFGSIYQKLNTEVNFKYTLHTKKSPCYIWTTQLESGALFKITKYLEIMLNIFCIFSVIKNCRILIGLWK